MDEPRVELMVMYDRALRVSSWGIFDMPDDLTDLILGSDEDDEDDALGCQCECGCATKDVCEDANVCDMDEALCHCWHEACECGQEQRQQASGYN